MRLGSFKYRIHLSSLIAGLLLILIGVLIYNDVLFKLNQYALRTNYVQELIIRAEEYMKQVFLR